MIIQANALHLPIASNTVQCVVTSPPYWGLRDYGIAGQLGLERTPEEYVANMVAVFREVRRVLKDDGTLWLNLGDSYGSGTSADRKPTSTQGDQVPASWSNRSQPQRNGFKAKDLIGIPWRVAFALQADGWYLRSDIIWSKPNPMPESVTDRPTKAHEYLFLLAKSERYYYDAEAIKEPSTYPEDNRKARQNPNDYKSLMSNIGQIRSVINPNGARTYENRNCRSVWHITTQPWSGAHFATFPEKLVEPCILAGSRPGDLVLDPFVGSGTVMRVATRLQRRSVGCDLNMEYLSQQATKRNKNVQVEITWTTPSATTKTGFGTLPIQP